MNCPRCGKASTGRFCPICGNPIENVASSPATPLPARSGRFRFMLITIIALLLVVAGAAFSAQKWGAPYGLNLDVSAQTGRLPIHEFRSISLPGGVVLTLSGIDVLHTSR